MDLVSRLKKFMDERQITISQFADSCNIPRPTMSQILSGRNKKISDELIGKIHTSFPELSVSWLLFGEGDMVTNANIEISEGQNEPQLDFSSQQGTDPQLFDPMDIEFERVRKNDPNNFEGNFGGQTGHTEARKGVMFGSAGQSAGSAGLNNGNYGNNGMQGARGAQAGGNASGNKLPQGGHIQNNSSVQGGIDFLGSAPAGENISGVVNSIAVATDSNKRIRNIVVFYDDNTFQTFTPANN